MSELSNLSLFPPPPLGHETVRVAEKKSNFSLLLNLGITSSSTTSIVLEEKEEEEEEEENMKEKSQSMKVKSMDLFPQNFGFSPSSTSVSVPKEDDDDDAMIISSNNNQQQQQQQQADDDFRSSVKLEPGTSTAPMTIFYGGKVFVFNNITVPKAKQIFNFAATNNAIFSSSHSAPTPIPTAAITTTGNNNNNNNNLNNSAGTVIPSVISSASNLAPASAITAAAAAAGMMMINSNQQNFKAPKLSDLPIQRKASLHRFLEKRKDRINARTPYNNQINISKSTESVADKVMQEEDKEESKFCLISSAY